MEDGKPSLTRYQMFLWTVIGILTYFGLVLGNIFNNYNNLGGLTLPDCPEVLLALMGISQATYLGGKFAFQSPSSSISRITSEKGIDTEVTIYGLSFGNETGSLILCGKTVDGKIIEWKNFKP